MKQNNFVHKPYYLGLDIGTDSVGYAVTDETYSLLKLHGEPMWGVSLFDEALLNAGRRSNRTARRRNDRKKQRIRLLSELFAVEIGKVDPKFFIRLKNSALYPEDKDEPGSLFGPDGYTDADYHKDFPTIHHLIVELMNSTRPHDVRLVYLACAWLVSHRGHFLNDINVDNIDELLDFDRVWGEFLDAIQADGTPIPWRDEPTTRNMLKDALKQKSALTAKYREVCRILFNKEKAPKDIPDLPWNIELLLKLLCGSKVDPCKLFGREEYKEIGSFSLDSSEDDLAKALTQLEENALIVERAKAVFDWSLLADSLDGGKLISEVKVAVYEQHKKDLAYLKNFVKKYLPDKYREVFRDVKKDNYTAYSLHCKKESLKQDLKKVANKEDFFKYLSKLIGNVEPDEEDRTGWEDMKRRIEAQTFLPKQRNTDNRVIPHQIYEKELIDILSSAKTYLPFLSEKDESGLTVSEKIHAIFTFRIPYFVGPLNPRSEYAWVKFQPGQTGPILPWNYAEKIDEEESEKQFIRKMTNRCTYLPDKDVLPKKSLLYSSFTVLNALNNLRIDGRKIPVALKQQIYLDLFLSLRKVTKKKLEDFLHSINALQAEQTLTGIDLVIGSDLGSWIDFKKQMEEGRLSAAEVEKIIERRTYSEDKGRFVKWLKEEYPNLPSEDIRYISGLNYNDFGRLSAAFLTELFGVDLQAGTGEAISVMQALWNTDCNLEQILSDRFTFRTTLEEVRQSNSNPKTLEERMDEMYISNAVKRPVFRALAIVREVVKATGAPPAKIFVEVTRGGTKEQKGKRTLSRKEQLLSLYEKCDQTEVRQLREELEKMGDDANSKLQSEALFLYYTQLGRCMYTGQPIDLKKLSDEKICNRDHIWPQAFVKDDSILNNKVLVLSQINGAKKDIYPISSEIRKNMHSFWTHLKDVGLITAEKYRRLTRATGFTEEEKYGFINRQLTETSQSAKAVATLLNEHYPNTDIVYVKAKLTSEFRQTFDLLKSRTFNDLHHAKDAYLNIVAGNVYDMKFSRQWFNINEPYSLKTRTLFTHPVICRGKTVWDGAKMLEKVKQTVGKNNAHLVRYSFCREGGLFDEQPVKKAKGLIPRKANLPTEKYGGYNKPSVSFFALAKYRSGNKSDVMVIPVEQLYKEEFLAGDISAESYAKRRIGQIVGKTVDEVSFPLGNRILKINTMLSLDGFRVCITGKSNEGKNLVTAPLMPFSTDRRIETYLKRLEVMVEKAKSSHFVYHAEYDKVTKEENLALYDLYIEKLCRSIYTKRPNNPLKILQNGRDQFIALSPTEQAKSLLNLHQIFGRNAAGCDLLSIGGSKHAATVRISSSLSNWKKKYRDVRIVDLSSSGLWEKKSDNLLKLL